MLGNKNLHILLGVREYQELRELSYRLHLPLSELSRQAIATLLKKHKLKDSQIPTPEMLSV